eukprot:6187894-Pleurochrysis_carterae.AAC.1
MVCCHPNRAWCQCQDARAFPSIHSSYSLNAHTDCVVYNITATQHHELFERKVVSPIPTGRASLPALWDTFAFANTEPRLLSTIVGSFPTLQQTKFQDVLRRGHVVNNPLILEVLGGFARHAQHLIHWLALERESHSLPDPVAAALGIRTPLFSAFHTQSISIVLHSAVDRQIAIYANFVPLLSLKR